jgi:hypothetical protein
VCVGGGGECGCRTAGVCLRACRLSYPVCHAQAPYCLRPLWLHHIYRHYLINGTIFGKKSLNIKCVFWFSLQLLFETFLILRRNQRDVVINVKRSSCKVPGFFLSEFNETWIFSTDFWKWSLKDQVLLKTVQGQPRCSMRTDTQKRTDMTKLIVAFCNFANAPENKCLCLFITAFCFYSPFGICVEKCGPLTSHYELFVPPVCWSWPALVWRGGRTAFNFRQEEELFSSSTAKLVALYPTLSPSSLHPVDAETVATGVKLIVRLDFDILLCPVPSYDFVWFYHFPVCFHFVGS